MRERFAMNAASIWVIYEDNHLLVVEKPPNIPTQADESGDPDLLSLLKADLKNRYQKPGNVYLGLVHRLDRPVGGAMVFAKTSKAAARLSEQVRTRQFKKTYYAVVHGIPEPSQSRLHHFLVKDASTNTSRTVKAEHCGAKEALLDYQVIKAFDNLSLIKMQLLTGRSHQIRVQMAAVGHPLLGDQKYGATMNKAGQQLALWAVEVEFVHPTQGTAMTFFSAPPETGPWKWFVPHHPV